MDADAGLGRFIEPVARAIFGEPNAHLSSKSNLRFGSQGSMHVDTAKGTAYSHEEKVGGGVLWLIEHEKKLHGAEAFRFMEEIGCDLPRRMHDSSTGESYLQDRRGNAWEEHKPAKIVAAYDYVDEAGDLLFQVVRLEPKTFRQRRRDADGNWQWSVRNVRPVPYRLPDVLEAIASERTIAIVEGEKDADRLWAIGIPATTNAGGAGKWRAEHAEIFRGADVLILCDNDNAGRSHGDQVGQSLAEIAGRVRLLDLPGLPAKGDVSDWIAAGGTRESFDALAESAPAWTLRPQAFISKFGGLRWEEIGVSAGTVGYTWLVEDIFPMGEISLVFGDTGSGKSFDIFDMGMAVARGIAFNARNVEPGLVVYVAAEAGKGFAKRKIAYVMQHRLEPSEPLPFYLCTKRPDFFHDDSDAVALIEEIRAVARSYRAPLVCIVVDTLSALAPGMNENASADVSMVRKRLVMLQEEFKSAVILVHHKPKNGSTPRGHGSLTADFETTVEFEVVADKRTDTGKLIHRATVRKQREGKSGAYWEFTLPVIEVGKNKWGNPETSCYVEPHKTTGPKPGVAGFHATPNEMLFMRALYDALLDHPAPPPAGLPAAIAKVVAQRHVRELMRDRMIAPHEDQSIADGRFRTAFSRAGSKLRDGGVLGIQGSWLWPTGKPIAGFGPVIESSL